MSSTISIGKAMPELYNLVEKAGKGQVHVITVHDQPVAQLGPIPSRAKKLTAAWREQRKGIFLNRKGQKRIDLGSFVREGRK